MSGGGEGVGEARRPAFAVAAALTYGTNLGVALLSLGNVLVVSWSLGPAGRGHVAFLTTVTYLTATAATMGVEESNANVGGREPALRKRLATNSLLLAVLLGAAGAAAVALLFQLVPGAAADSDPLLRRLALVFVPVVVAGAYFDYLVRAEYGHGRANLAWLLQPVTNVTANGALALAGELTVGRVVAVWLAGQTLSVLLLLDHVLRRGSGFGRPDLALARRTVGFGLKAHSSRLMTIGNYRLDQWLVGALAGPRELGLYSVAVAWAEALFYLPTALVTVQRPDLVRAARDEAVRRASALFRFAMLATPPFAVGLLLAAPLLCTVILPGSFSGAVDDLRVLALGGFGIAAMKLLGNALVAQRLPLRTTAGVGVAFAATLALDVALIPPLGGLGAAIASTVSYTVGGLAIALLFAGGLGGSLRELVPGTRDVALVSRGVGRLVVRGAQQP